MGYVSEFVRMIFIIFIFFFMMPLSLQTTHIWSVDALWNAEETFPNLRVHGLSEMYSTEENVRENDKQIEKISGQDEIEEKEPLIVTKLRALLGLRSSIHKRPNGDSEHVSPSPSPLPSREAEPPAPPPLSVLHVHAHPRHHHRQNPLSHGIQNEDRDRAKTILRAVLASVGVAAVLSALGLIWVFRRKFRNHNNKAKRTPPPCSKKKSSPSKVSMNSGIDLFYLNSLGDDIEQHSLKQTCEAMNVNTTSNPSSHRCGAVYDSEEPKQEVMSSEYDNASSSISTKEIVSVQEDTKSVNYDYESECEPGGEKSSSGDEIIPIECNSSDNESFHSFVDSHSSNVRISNASAAGSRSETSSLSAEASQPELSLDNSTDTKTPLKSSLPSSSQNSISHKENPKHEEEKSDNSLQCPPNFTRPLPTPPPPPPPPMPMPLFQLHSLSYSSEISSQSPRSSKLHNLTSPRFSNQSRESKMLSPSEPSPSKSYPSIPPPPPFEGNYNNVKTPPPPPSRHPQFTPLGKDGVPLPKLKPLHWDKVRAAPNRTMVWDKLRSSSFELDEEMIESLFGYNLQNSTGNDEAKSKSPSPSKHILEPKRLQNITILSKALNATSEQVCDSLIQGNGLYLQQLEALVKMVPTKEEAAKLSGYKGDINELASAERFVRAMLSVPLAFQRVEAMLYRETFEDEVVHLRNSFSMLEEACKELRSSRLFLKLLEAVLKTGNRMNVGTIRGGARAFKLDALLKLADVKGADGKTTLLHFVVQEIVRSEGIRASDSIMGKINQKSKNRTEEEKEEDYRKMGLELVSGLSTELFNVKKTATIDMDVLASSVSNLSQGMAKLQHLIYKELCMDEKSENFVNSMKSFIKYADKCLKDLREDENRVLARVREITEYFHGDVSKEDANFLRIFVIVRDFLSMLDNVCKELRRSRASRSPNPLAPFR